MLEECRQRAHVRLTACYPAHLLDSWSGWKEGEFYWRCLSRFLVDLALIGKDLLNIITLQGHRASYEHGSAII